MKRSCKVPGCERDHACKGYCNLHYLRWWKYGDPNHAVRGRDPNPPEVCTVPDCHGKHVAKGFCWRHYKQMKRYGEIDEEKANDGRRNRPKAQGGLVSLPAPDRSKNDEIKEIYYQMTIENAQRISDQNAPPRMPLTYRLLVGEIRQLRREHPSMDRAEIRRRIMEDRNLPTDMNDPYWDERGPSYQGRRTLRRTMFNGRFDEAYRVAQRSD